MKTPEQLRTSLEALRERVAELDHEYRNREMPDDARREWNEANAEIESISSALEETRVRRERVAQLARQGGGERAGEGVPDSRGPAQARDEALRTIERHADRTDSKSQDQLDRHLRSRDPHGIDARWVSAVGDEHYMTAFGKLLQDPRQGHNRFTAPEQEAVQKVTEVQTERAMQESVGASGGFAVPYTLDPSLLFSSDGSTNPIRQLARVEQIVTKEWRGVSTEGTVASFVPELTEASDDSPTLAQPTVSAHRWQAFIPASIELLGDWPNAQGELARVLSDARDQLEASKFLDGDGDDEPSGVLDGLTNTQRVQVASAGWNTGGTFATNATYAVTQALPERFRPNASYTANPSSFDKIYRAVGGNSVEPPVLPNREGPLLARPISEWSTMYSGTAAGEAVLLYGDFRQYLIAERLGMTVEVVQHVFGTAHRPIGARGLYAYGRTGGSAVVQNAFRYLEIS